MNKKFKRLYEYCKSQGYTESQSTFEQDLKDLAVEELHTQELSKVSGGKKATTALTAGVISALSIASPLASANQVYYFDSSAPHCGITSEKPKSDSDSKNKLRNILIKSGIALAGTGVVGGGIILTAALLKSKLDPEESFKKHLSSMLDESAQKLKNYYGSLQENDKREINNFIYDNIKIPERDPLKNLDAFLVDKFLKNKTFINDTDWNNLCQKIIKTESYNDILGILEKYKFSSDSAVSNNSLAGYIPLSLIRSAFTRYDKDIKNKNKNLEKQPPSLSYQKAWKEVVQELMKQIGEDYKNYCPSEPLTYEPPQGPITWVPLGNKDVIARSDVEPSPSLSPSLSPSSSEDEEDGAVEPLAGPPSDVQSKIPIQPPREEWQKISDEDLELYEFNWYTWYLEQNFVNCIHLYEQLSPKERMNIRRENFWEFMSSIFDYFKEGSHSHGTVVKRIDSYDCSTLHDCVRSALQEHGAHKLDKDGGHDVWAIQNEHNPIYKLPQIVLNLNNRDGRILDFNQLREDFENFADHTSHKKEDYFAFCESLQIELNDCIEKINQAASQSTVSPDPTQVVSEPPQQPLASTSPLSNEEPQQLPNSDPSTQGTGFEEPTSFFVDITPSEQPIFCFSIESTPLPSTVDQPTQEPSHVNDIQFDPNSAPEPNLDSTGDDKSYNYDHDHDSE